MILEKLSQYIVGRSPQEMRGEFHEKDSSDLRRRRAIIGLSLFGIGIAGVVSLLQTGIVKHLPDPPLRGFDADKVILSDEAYQFGVPDATIALAGLAANVPLAAFGGADRVHEQPFVPILATGKAALEAVAAGWYFYQMPTKEKAWCAYCITGALIYFGILALTLPEAGKAISELQKAD
jgi:uncharacterized membrane protein